ncbi:MAG: hypothetical protein CMJ50_08105 [Planctomycetaceae bacterium]|nr:hypothetical protein [Planctomycetaceae bacterium]
MRAPDDEGNNEAHCPLHVTKQLFSPRLRVSRLSADRRNEGNFSGSANKSGKEIVADCRLCVRSGHRDCKALLGWPVEPARPFVATMFK